MSESTSPDDEGLDTQAARQAHPSGWLELTRHEGVPVIVDALLDLPPGREFNKTELAEFAGVTRQTVGKYADLLLAVEVIERVPETSPQRYRLADGEVVEAIFTLNAAVNDARDG